jgi:hypothetical protein
MKYIPVSIETLDKITLDSLIETRRNWIEDLGCNRHIFVYGDSEADDAEIQKHIGAIDLIINWYATHEQLEEIYGKVSD